MDDLANQINNGTTLDAGGTATLKGKTILLATEELDGLVDKTTIDELAVLPKLLFDLQSIADLNRVKSSARNLRDYSPDNYDGRLVQYLKLVRDNYPDSKQNLADIDNADQLLQSKLVKAYRAMHATIEKQETPKIAPNIKLLSLEKSREMLKSWKMLDETREVVSYFAFGFFILYIVVLITLTITKNGGYAKSFSLFSSLAWLMIILMSALFIITSTLYGDVVYGSFEQRETPLKLVEPEYSDVFAQYIRIRDDCLSGKDPYLALTMSQELNNGSSTSFLQDINNLLTSTNWTSLSAYASRV